MLRVQLSAGFALALASVASWGCASTPSRAQVPDGQNAQGERLSYLCASDIPGSTISVQKNAVGMRVSFQAHGRNTGTLRNAMMGQTLSPQDRSSERRMVPTRDLPSDVRFRVEEIPGGASITYAGKNEAEGDLIHALVDSDVLRLQGGGCSSLQSIESTAPSRPASAPPESTPPISGRDSGGSDREPRSR